MPAAGGNGLDLIIYGALIMLIALLKPEGILSLFRRDAQAGERGMSGESSSRPST